MIWRFMKNIDQNKQESEFQKFLRKARPGVEGGTLERAQAKDLCGVYKQLAVAPEIKLP